jgi:hypothetical protein
MPVTYVIHKGLIRARCFGHVTFPEVADHFGQLVADPECPGQLDVLLDLRDTTSIPSTEQLRAVGAEIERIRDRVRFGACAIVAGSPALFGTARVFEVIAARGFRETQVFRGATEAEQWLAERRTDAP